MLSSSVSIALVLARGRQYSFGQGKDSPYSAICFRKKGPFWCAFGESYAALGGVAFPSRIEGKEEGSNFLFFFAFHGTSPEWQKEEEEEAFLHALIAAATTTTTIQVANLGKEEEEEKSVSFFGPSPSRVSVHSSPSRDCKKGETRRRRGVKEVEERGASQGWSSAGRSVLKGEDEKGCSDSSY